jgi:Kef-type K+ transport system membrane component KefB
LRTLSFGLLTPFYFIRAGLFVSLPALAAAPPGFVALLLGRMASKCIGVYPATQVFRAPRKEAIYTTLLMSTGLTFGTISALFGLSRGVITQAQNSAPVAAVVARRRAHADCEGLLSAAAPAGTGRGVDQGSRPNTATLFRVAANTFASATMGTMYLLPAPN